MAQTLREFADLNDMTIDEARNVARGWTDTTNPAFRDLVYEWLAADMMGCSA